MATAPLSSPRAELDRRRLRRARRLRAVGGACRFIIAAVAALAALLAVDAALQLSAAARCVLELAAAGIMVLLARHWLWLPWQDEVADTAETEADAAPAARIAGFALAVLAVAVTLATALPGAGERLRRAALPWQRSTTAIPFEIIVTSGDAVVRRGDPITLTAYLRPRDAAAATPDSATLIIRDGPDATESHIPMTSDGAATFHATRPAAAGDFEYQIAAGHAVSPWHTIRVADAVELTEPTAIEIVPPAYTQRPESRRAGFGPIEVWQFSRIVYRFHFSRPAASAALEWRPDGRSVLEPPDAIPIRLAADRTSGAAELDALASGTLRLILANEDGPRKLRTELSAAVRARIDAPPRFERIDGITPFPLTVRPGQRIAIEMTATDELGIAAADLEYQVNDGTIARLPIPLTGSRTHADGRLLFDLVNMGKAGDVVRYRLRIQDNRDLGAAIRGVQEAFFPPRGWSELRLAAAAPPLDQQSIFGRRDSLRKVLGEQIGALKLVREEAEQLRRDSAGIAPLPIDQGFRLAALRDRVRQVKTQLAEAAKDAALTAALRPLAAALRDLMERALAEADDAFRNAATDDAAARAALLGTGLSRLQAAGEQLGELLNRNDRLAQACLDSGRLAALAADEEALAALANGATANDKVLARQRELLARLQAVVAGSDALQRGSAAAAVREMAALAADARALAAALHELDAAANRAGAELRETLLTDIAAAQFRFAQRLDERLNSLEIPIRLTGIAAPRREELLHAAELIRQDRVLEALTEQERFAQALDRLADEFESAAAERTDPKFAAGQLAKWQDDLRGRLIDAIKTTPFDRLPESQRNAFHSEQEALLSAAELLNLPPDRTSTVRRTAVLEELQTATNAIAADGRGAAEAMKRVAESLQFLADKTPTAPDRRSQSRGEIDKLRVDQEALGAAAEAVLRQYERAMGNSILKGKLAAVQRQQQQLGERLALLDLPGLESRHARAVRASRSAAADLKAGLRFDANAALAGAKRELDRLLQAIDNQPIDDRVAELARKQTALARSVFALGDRAAAAQFDPIAADQDELVRRLAMLNSRDAPEALGLFEEAHESVKAAAASLGIRRDPENIRRRMGEAADALRLLADRLQDREPERDRLLRLAANRRQAVCAAKQLTGRSNPAAARKAALELGHEIEALHQTRVGAGGQLAKKTVLDLYAKLQMRSDPERHAAEQKRLADALAQLAATLDAAELTTRPIPPPHVPNRAAAFLPTREAAETLREFARQQREWRERTNAVAAELIRAAKPASVNPLAAIAKRQEMLAAAAEELARSLATDDARAAAARARHAFERIRVGAVQEARESAAAAARQLGGIAAAAELAADQNAILGELQKIGGDPTLAAAQQLARMATLADQLHDFALRLDGVRQETADEAGAPALAEAANQVRLAERRWREAAKPFAAGMPAEAGQLRAASERLLRDAADRAAAARGPAPIEVPDADALAAGAAVREAERAMQRAIGEHGNTAAALRRASVALHRAVAAFHDLGERGASAP